MSSFLIENADVDDSTKSSWKNFHQTGVIEYAENLGLGNRNYCLVEVD